MATDSSNKPDIDTVAVIEQYVPLKKSGHSYMGLCPFHTDTNRSLSVFRDKDFWKCFGCGAKGDAIGFVMRYHHCRYPEALRIIEQQLKLAITRPAPVKTKPVAPSNWRQHFESALSYQGSPAERYLQSRSIVSAIPVAAGVRYHPNWLRGGPAVIFPITDQNGTVVAAQGRYHSPNASPKCRSKGPVEDGLFVTPKALTSRYIIIVEGPIDALSFAACGFGAVATCGAGHFPQWLIEACRGKRVFLAQDHDQAGNHGAQVLADALYAAHISAERLNPPEGAGDWNNYLQRYRVNVMCAIVALALLTPGDTVVDRHGHWCGTVKRIKPPGVNSPYGRVIVRMDDSIEREYDMRDVRDENGRLLAPPES